MVPTLYLLLSLVVFTWCKEAAASLVVAIVSDGTFQFNGPEPGVVVVGPPGVQFLKDVFNTTEDAPILEFRQAAIDHFASSLKFDSDVCSPDVLLEKPVVLGGCPVIPSPTNGTNSMGFDETRCRPTTIVPYMSVLSLRSFAVARNDQLLPTPARLTDGGFMFAAGTAGFETRDGVLRLPQRAFFGVQKIQFVNETLLIKFRNRGLLVDNFYDFDAEAVGYGNGSMGGGWKFTPSSDGTWGQYQDWIIGSFGMN